MSVIQACPSIFRTANDRYVSQSVLLASALFLIPVSIGCGENDVGDRVPLEGKVIVAGEPLMEKATIYFNPIAGSGGIGSMGQVTEGYFEIPYESGPTPGMKYRVKVTTSPGIPPDGTPLEEITFPETYTTEVEIPSREEGGDELVIEFE